jgi:hypothetical protein
MLYGNIHTSSDGGEEAANHLVLVHNNNIGLEREKKGKPPATSLKQLPYITFAWGKKGEQ